LDEPEQVASVLENLIKSNNILMAYQLGFDLYESATQQFLHKVKNLLKALVNIPQPMDTDSSSKPISSDDVKIEESSNVSKKKNMNYSFI
jgi:26S proteasome regulatory subunit N2